MGNTYPPWGGGVSEAKKKFVYLKSASNFLFGPRKIFLMWVGGWVGWGWPGPQTILLWSLSNCQVLNQHVPTNSVTACQSEMQQATVGKSFFSRELLEGYCWRMNRLRLKGNQHSL